MRRESAAGPCGEAGTGVPVAWRANCRGVPGPADGKLPRDAARGRGFVIAVTCQGAVTVTGRSPRSRNEAGLTRGHGPSAHEPDMPADLGARGVCHALIGRGASGSCWPCGAGHVKNLPGRRTDLAGSGRLARLLERGPLAGGFTPRPGSRPPCAAVVRACGRGAGTARQRRDRGGARSSPAWPRPRCGPRSRACPVALDGRFGGHHALTRRPRLEHIGHLEAAIAKLDAQTEVMTTAFPAQPELLTAVPGAGPPAAAAPIREPAATREHFPGAAHLAPRTRAAPRQPPTRPANAAPGSRRQGNQRPQPQLAQRARSAVRRQGCPQSLHHRHVTKSGGRRSPSAKNKATATPAHAATAITWHVLATGQPHQQPGAGYFASRPHPQRETQRLIAKLQAPGHQPALHPAA